MDLNLLQQLSQAVGVSGQENAVRDLLEHAVKPYAHSIVVTPLGNLIVEKKGAKPAPQKCMISAHMDEVGLVILEIAEDGALSFAPVGGLDSAVLVGKSVFVNGSIPGVIGAKPVHLLSGDEVEKKVSMGALFIDIGATTKAEAETCISIGDTASFPPFFAQNAHTVMGKALDNRIGCFLLTQLIKSNLPYDCTFVFSVQGEVGCRGAQTAAQIILPEIAISVEATAAGDVLGNTGPNINTKLGQGPAISILDSGTVYDRAYYKLVLQTAKALGIPCQARTGSTGTGEAAVMHSAGLGARPLAISVPCRYPHGPVSVASIQDIENAEKVLYALLKSIYD